jgi:hypothetical protein
VGAGIVFGFALTVFAVLLPSLPLGVLLAVVLGLLAKTLPLPRALKQQRGTTVTAPALRGAAFVPVVLGTLAFVAYGVVASVVHVHYFGKQYSAAVAALTRSNALDEKYKIRDAATKLVIEQGRAAIKSGHLTPVEVGREERRLLAAVEGFNSENEAEIKAAELVHVPSTHDLPPWFGRLYDFFVAATSILAGLVIALVLAGSIEPVVRVSLLFSVVGLVAGVVGSLPSVSPSLHAILLGPLTAGLVAAVAALAVYAAGALEVIDSGGEA